MNILITITLLCVAFTGTSGLIAAETKPKTKTKPVKKVSGYAASVPKTTFSGISVVVINASTSSASKGVIA